QLPTVHLDQAPRRGTARLVHADAGRHVLVGRHARCHIGHGQRMTGNQPLGHGRLARAGATEHHCDHAVLRPPARTAACTARARRAPHTDRGPPKALARPSSGQATHTASVAVPVAARPSSRRACTLASVAVTTVFTRAASDNRSGTTAST